MKLLQLAEECREKAKAKAEKPDAKDPGPESEELVRRTVIEEKKSTKKKEEGPANSSFEAKDRFDIKK